MSRIPPTIDRYVVPAQVLLDSRELLRERGRRDLEAVVVWVGRVLDETTGAVVAALRPGQVAYLSEAGCAVEVPPEALSELIAALPEGVVVLARLHTHPTVAYHSPVDDTNMLISHHGAISIVVPFFARNPIDLAHCSVNRLVHGVGWVELSAEEVTDGFEIR